MGEFLALAVSLEHLSRKSNNPQAKVLADCLDKATEKLLLTGKSPSRKVGELDNRGSHFYLALYWAEALAGQTEDIDLQNSFEHLAKSLRENENKIVEELNSAQGKVVDIEGYYLPNKEKVAKVMRPSQTFNAILSEV